MKNWEKEFSTTKYNKLKEVITKAVPSPIRLADVLRTYEEKQYSQNDVRYSDDLLDIITSWNLKSENNLQTQIKENPELGEFLYELLVTQ